MQVKSNNILQDPSVSSAPLEQKVSFLRSKNLTQEEIDASLARVGQSPTAQPPIQQYQAQTYTQQYRQQPQQYGNTYQQYPPPWNQYPPEPPRRDWRDWFIMATVVGGVGSAMYWMTKRYIYPLIAPPTPPQLEQDKASIDSSFDKAFALLDQLATDTQELKDSEAERKQRMDHALAEVESVIGKMKEANVNRDMEAKRFARELEDIKEQIPEAIKKDREATDGRLRDLTTEMKSLKTLVGNRMGGGGGGAAAAATTNGTHGGRPLSSFSSSGGVNGTNGSSAPAVQAPESQVNGTNNASEQQQEPEPRPSSTPATTQPSALPERSSSASSPFSARTLGGKAQIPSWQLAAKKKAEEAKSESQSQSQGVNGSGRGGGAGSESGTVEDAGAGA